MFDFPYRRRIYLDYASTTPVSSASIRAMREAENIIGNPGSIHEEGVLAGMSIQDSRTKIAAELGCKAREVIFTSGITESNNLAILGLFKRIVLGGETPKQTHWITTAIEHASVLACFEHIKEMGGIVSFINPDARGIISADAIKKELRKETACVSIGWANNEIGVVQPLSSIARAIHAHEEKHGTRVVFHSDAGQAPLYLPPQAHTLGVDLFALGGSKIYGPHGAGCLYVNNRAELAPVILGGGQERGLRAGTENVALAAGFARALKEAGRERAKESKRLKKLRDDFAGSMIAQIEGAIVNGSLEHALPHILNISIPNINSEYLLLALDREGIALSTKSSCREGEKASHVVSALGGPPWRAENTLRFSLGTGTAQMDLNRTLKILASIVSTLRLH